MTYRPSRSSRILSSLALALLIVPAPYAGISGSNSASVSIGDLSTEDLTTLTTTTATSSSDKFTTEDLAILRERRTEATTKIADITAQIAALKKDGKTDSVTTLRLTQLNKELSDLKELNSVLDALINQAIIDTTPTTGGLGGLGGSDDDGSSGSGGSQIIDQIKQAAVNALVQSFLGGGNNALQNLTSSLTGGLTGGLGGGLGGTPGTTPGGTPGRTPSTPPAEPTPDPYAGLPSCAATEANPGKAEDDKIKPTSTGSSTDTNPGKAEDDKITPAGTGSTDANPGKDKDDKVTSTEDAKKAIAEAGKPKCRPVDVTTPNPVGTGKAAGVGADKITSVADARNAVGQFHCDPSNSNCSANNQQCASLTKKFAPEVGRASEWRKGDLVKGNTELAVGTPIATFNYGNSYCQVTSSGCGVPGGGVTHTGIYLGQNSEGIQVLHQYSGRPAEIKTLRWNGNKISGNMYYTIKRAGSSSLRDIIPVLQPVWMALKLVPLDAGLLKG